MKQSFRQRSREIIQDGPPRLRLLRWLRSIFLMAQPPLLCKEGNNLTATIHARRREKVGSRLRRWWGFGEDAHHGLDQKRRVQILELRQLRAGLSMCCRQEK